MPSLAVHGNGTALAPWRNDDPHYSPRSELRCEKALNVELVDSAAEVTELHPEREAVLKQHGFGVLNHGGVGETKAINGEGRF